MSRQNFQDSFVEVQKVRESGDIVIVKVTQNPSASLKNVHILRALKDASPPKPPIFEPYSVHKNPRYVRKDYFEAFLNIFSLFLNSFQ